MKHQHVALGGTFDHLHAGHKHLVDYAFSLSEHVSIGVVTDEFMQQKQFPHSIQPFTERKHALLQFLTDQGYGSRVTIIPLTTIYGITDTDTSVEALVVTEETYHNGHQINEVRKKNNLKPLIIYTVDYVKGNDGHSIKSERIREGIIDREGFSYLSLFPPHTVLVLPPQLRPAMRKPLGRIFKSEQELIHYLESVDCHLCISVGDIITQSLQKAGHTPSISVIDHKTRRQSVVAADPQELSYANMPATISYTAVHALYTAIRKATQENTQTILHITGEEDLLALPAILLAPLGSCILYGQHDLGAVATRVTEERKYQIKNLAQQFSR